MYDGFIEIKYLHTSWSSMTDAENCILWFSHWHQLLYNSNCYARPQNPRYEFLYQSLPKGKRVSNVIYTVLYWFLGIGVVFFANLSTGWAFRLSLGRRCMCADRQNTMLIYSRSYEGAQIKWKVETQIHWIEFISVDTLACRNEWNSMRYVCPLVKHQRRFQSLTRTICCLVLNICFTFWKKWALNRLQIYFRSDCMGYQCHIWRKTLITKFFLKSYIIWVVFDSYMPTPGTHTMLITGIIETQVGTRRNCEGRRCENATDSRCMCTGWAFYLRVGEWVTRRDCGDQDIGCRVVVLVVAAGLTCPITYK